MRRSNRSCLTATLLISFGGGAEVALPAAQPESLTLAHWNPHFRCFDLTAHPECSAGANTALTSLLTTGCTGEEDVACDGDALDFASLIEFELSGYAVPPGWKAIGAGYASCGRDWATIFYNSERWQPAPASAEHPVSQLVGCDYDGRSFAAGSFVRTTDVAVRLSVVSSHYPQTLGNATAYAKTAASIQGVLASMDRTNVVFMGDTNTEGPEAAAKQVSHHGTNRTNGELL